jgi:hypothetical protein
MISPALWEDESGNGYDAEQLLEDRRPALDVENALVFDGVDDDMNLPDAVAERVGANAGFYAVIVCKVGSGSPVGFFFGLNGPGFEHFIFGTVNPGPYKFRGQIRDTTGINVAEVQGGTPSDLVYQIVEIFVDPTVSELVLRVDGVEQDRTATLGIVTGTTKARLGAFPDDTNHISGAMKEVLVLDRYPAGEERAEILTYLSTKFSIPVTIPPGG